MGYYNLESTFKTWLMMHAGVECKIKALVYGHRIVFRKNCEKPWIKAVYTERTQKKENLVICGELN